MTPHAPAAMPLEDIRGLKPYWSIGPDPHAIFLVLVILGVLAFVFYYLARQGGVEPAVTILSEAPKTIRGRLDSLRASRLAEKGDAAKFCDQLSEILRDFILARYGVSSRRLTSSELLAELARRRIPGAVSSHLEAVFTACDLVKFAKVRLQETELHQHLTAAYLILEFAERPDAEASR